VLPDERISESGSGSSVRVKVRKGFLRKRGGRERR